VRHTERHIRNDPPTAPELEALAEDVRKLIFAELAAAEFFDIRKGIAVAGTPTSLAAIEQELDPYDPEQVHGYVLTLDGVQRMYSMLSGKSLEERLNVTGLHPGRAPTIVAGVVILIQAMRAFCLQRIEVSEHDILDGAALAAAGYPE
jgi:exopolyphosphatase/guanosine-5'-triphosphate,3'-diphosphate pyrophosphatase